MMKISFLVNEVAGGWKPTDKFLGGTEESVVRWATELTKRRHEITIYDNDSRSSYRGGEDVCVNVKSSDIPPLVPTLYLTNEFNASQLDLSRYTGVIWPSKWAVDNIPVNNQTFILPHGYDDKLIKPSAKIPKQCFYASSPDRGLEHLLKIWPSVMEVHPDATLILTYGVTGIDLPGVIPLGQCDEQTMSDIYATSDLWLHPCSGGELYCMTGKKAQVAGCVPVIIPRGALKETVKTGYMCDSEDDYLNLLTLVLDKPQEDRDVLREDIIKNANAYSWEKSTDILEDLLKKTYNKQITK